MVFNLIETKKTPTVFSKSPLNNVILAILLKEKNPIRAEQELARLDRYIQSTAQ